MLDLRIIREDPDRIRQALRDRGFTHTTPVDEVIQADAQRRHFVTQQQALRAQVKQTARSIGTLMRQGKRQEADQLIADQARLKQNGKEFAAKAAETDETLRALLLSLPNVPHESVPVGRDAADNAVVHAQGEMPEADFELLPHWELAEHLGLIDFARGSKVAGAGFPFYVGMGARLQRALIQFFLDQAARFYTEIQPPLFINEDSVRGTGQLPDKEGQMYHVRIDNLYPVPTAEVPLTNYYRGEILSEADLPIKLCAHTPCWRREAGSYGAHVRGLNRLHQFDKVELVQFTHPNRSYDALETMRADAENLLTLLGLPWRRLLMCTGDMGFNQAKQYDLEVWSAGQQRWLEVSSVSNFTSYQARRMSIRYRPAAGGKPRLVHTLNGSALALPRIVAVLLENNQRPDRSIALPEVLHSYMGIPEIR
ncbi:MAG: serine--tRNA ligase [Bacteroidota bacterium]|nr:serine--tRNA ligase [Bacteroidota bacterium]